MAKKKNKLPGTPGKKTRSSDFPPGLAVFIGFLLGAGLTWMVLQEEPPSSRPPATPTGPAAIRTGTTPDGKFKISTKNMTAEQAQSMMLMQQQIDGAIQMMEMNPGRIPAEDEAMRFDFAHPTTGRHLLVLGRAQGGGADHWNATVVRTGKDPLSGDAPKNGLEIEASFELGGAESMETATFSEGGNVGRLLTRAHNRGQAPGDLIRLAPGEDHARKIDTNVFRFTLSPDGDVVLYERAVNSEDLLGKRELKLFHASSGEIHRIQGFDYPKVQIGTLGPWDETGVFADLTIQEYLDGFEPSSTKRYRLDGFNPTKLIPLDE
jgi:hypothetical protein